jgi:hypothetical protein
VRRLVVLDLIGAVLVLVVAVTARRVWRQAGPERATTCAMTTRSNSLAALVST